VSRPTSYFWWKMSAAKWKLGKSPNGDALRKGDFSLRQERSPARVRSIQECGISKVEMGTVNRHVPGLKQRKRTHDQYKQLSS
jgi:hypothetical protein